MMGLKAKTNGTIAAANRWLVIQPKMRLNMPTVRLVHIALNRLAANAASENTKVSALPKIVCIGYPGG